MAIKSKVNGPVHLWIRPSLYVRGGLIQEFEMPYVGALHQTCSYEFDQTSSYGFDKTSSYGFDKSVK